MADPEVDPYTHTKFTDEGQASVHNGLVKLIRSRIGEDLSDLNDGEVLQAAHMAYAPDMEPDEFVAGAKMVMSEKLHGAAQAEADKRATAAGHETTENLKLSNVHVGPTPIKGVSVSGVPGVEERKGVLKTAGNVAKEIGKGVIRSLATPLPALMEWVGAHGLADEELAPGVRETRFAGAEEQDKLEREAVRKVAQATLDTVGYGLGVAEVGGLLHLPGFTNAFGRLATEGAAWGATYEGIDAALAGESADKVAGDAVKGAVLGSALTLGVGGIIHGATAGLSKLASSAIDETAAKAAASAKSLSDFPAMSLSPGERVALSIQRDGGSSLAPEAAKYLQMAQRGDMGPQDAAIHLLGNLGVINDPAGTAAVAKLIEPRALVPIAKEMALTVPEATAARLEASRASIKAASDARRMAEEAATYTSELRTRAREEKWGSEQAQANLAEQVPEPLVLAGGADPILLGPGVDFKVDGALALKEAAAQMPHLRMTRVPNTTQGKLMSSVYKIGQPVYDLTGTPHEVLGYSTSGKVVVRRQYPDGVWAYHALPATNLSPNPSGFLSALNRFEAGAKARLAVIERNPRLSTGLATLEGAREYIEIGLGKFGRAAYMASKASLSEDQIYIMWAKDMADLMRANGHEDQIQFLPKMFTAVKRDYGETMATLVLRDSSMREGLYDAVDRMKAGGWVGHDWYDNIFPKLVETFGDPVDAARFSDFLAITSANRNIDANTNLALQAFAQWQVGEVPKGYGPNIDAMFAKYVKAEAEGGNLPAISQFAGASSAPKVAAFVGNVRGGDVNQVTLDVWMNRYLKGSETLGVKEKEAAKAIIREIAAKEGLTPRQVQAAMWADARIASQILEPLNKTGKVSMTLGSLRPYDETTARFIAKRGHFLPEAQALKHTRKYGGGTFYPGTYRPYDKPGFVVELGSTKLNAEKALPNQLRESVNAYLGPLKKIAEERGAPLDFTVGTWKPENEPYIYAGVSVVLPDRKAALHLAELGKQYSIAELGEGGAFKGTIETGAEAASSPTVTEAKKALTEYLHAPPATR